MPHSGLKQRIYRGRLTLLAVALSLFAAVPASAQDVFFTQSGGRGLQNAKLNARMSKTESDVVSVQIEMAKVQPHAKSPIVQCGKPGDKIRWDGTKWLCESENDPTVQPWAKEALPSCANGQVLSAIGGRFGCAADGGLVEEKDPTVQQFAKSPLPNCGSGEVLSVAGDGGLRCMADNTGLAQETDPFVHVFARTDTGPVPNCASNQVLTMNNARLQCQFDSIGITEEADPLVAHFARNDVPGYTLAACAADEVLVASSSGSQVILQCQKVADMLVGVLALDDLSDVETAGQANGKVLMFDGTIWKPMDENDPTVQVWAKNNYTLNACGTGQVLSFDGTKLVCINDAGGSADPIMLSDLGDVTISSPATGELLRYNGTGWENSADKVSTLASGKWCSSDGNVVTCELDAPLNCDPDEVLKWDGSAWACVNAATGLGLGTMAVQNANNVSITGGSINGTAIGNTNPSTGVFTNITATSATLGNLEVVNIYGTGLFRTPSLQVSQALVQGNGRVTGDFRVDGNFYVSGSQTIDGVTFANGGIVASGSIVSGRLDVTNASVTQNLDVGGNIVVGGMVSATSFRGDGSQLTGVNASAVDWYNVARIPSQVAAVSNGTAISMTGISTTYGRVTRDLWVDGNLYVSGSQTIDGVTFANGGIQVSGSLTGNTVSATYGYFGHVSGSGAGLYGIPASAVVGLDLDRITSGTSGVVVNSNTGIVSLTQFGAATGYFHPSLGYVGPGVSVTGAVSASRAYVTNQLNIANATASSAALNVSGSAYIGSNGSPVADTYSSLALGERPAHDGIVSLYFKPESGSGFKLESHATSLWIHNVATNSTSLVVNALNQVGIATLSPMVALDVSGTLKISNSGEFCDSNRIGAIRYANGDFAVCRNGSAWETFTSIAQNAAGLADRISSGTTQLVVTSATGFVSLTQAGTNTGWFDPSRGLVTLGVSATGPISGTKGYFSGYVGIGTTNPQEPLHVVGTAQISGTTDAALAIKAVANGYADLELKSGSKSFWLSNRNDGLALVYSPDNGGTYAVPLVISGTTGNILIGSGAFGASLTVAGGEIQTSSGGAACSNALRGAIRYTGGDFAVCRNGSAWETFTSIAQNAAGLADRISSGTTQLVVTSATGFVSLTQAGTNTGWFDPSRGLVTLGVSATGPISGTAGYFSNWVGIAKVAPEYPLDISHAGQVSLRLAGANTDSPVIRFENTGAAGRTYHVGSTQGSGAGNGFSIYDVSASAPRFLIDANGRVGVGGITLGLAQTFTVSGTGWIQDALYVGRATDASSYVRLNSSASGYNVLAFADTNVEQGRIQYQNSNDSLQIVVSGTEAMRIVSTGYVGIGTATPRTALDVSGGITVGSTGTYPTVAWRRASDGNAVGTIGFVPGTNNNFSFANTGGNGYMTWYTNDAVTNAERMRLTTNGYLGLSTSAPSTTLHVSGSIRLAAEASTTLQVCDGNRVGAIKYESGDFSVCRNGSAWETFTSIAQGAAGLADRISSGTTQLVVTSATGFVSLTQAGTNTGWFDPTRGLVTLGISTTGPAFVPSLTVGVAGSDPNHIFFRNASGFTSATVGYGVGSSTQFSILNNAGLNSTISFFVGGGGSANRPMTLHSTSVAIGLGNATQPSTTLHVSGTVRMADGGEVCDANRMGAIKYSGGDFSVCRNGSSWETFTSIAQGAAGLADRISSGTTSVIAYNNSSVTTTINGTPKLIVTPQGIRLSGADIQSSKGDGFYIGSNMYYGSGAFRFIGDSAGGAIGIRNNNGGIQLMTTANTPVTDGLASPTTVLYAANTGNIGIGTMSPAYQLHVVSATAQFGLNNFLLRDDYVNTSFVLNNGAGLFYNNAGLSGLLYRFHNTSASPTLSIYNDGTVIGPGQLAARYASLTVEGAVKVSGTSVSCDGNVNGAMKFESGDFQVCRNGSTWETLTSIAQGAAGLADRITSGTTQLVVVSNTGFVSLTQAGTNTGWFDPTRGLVALGVSTTGGISGTTGYFGNLGLGIAAQTSQALIINSTGTNQGLALTYNGSVTPAVYLGAGSAGSGVIRLQGSTGIFAFSNSANQAFVRMFGQNARMSVGTGNSGMASSTLQVFGAVQVADTADACDSNRIGAIKYAGGDFSVCRDGVNWETFSSIANGGAIDRIVSGTSNVIVNNNSSVTITTNGVDRVTVGANGNMGVGVATPVVKLDVYDNTQAIKFRVADESLPNAAASAGSNYAEFYGGGVRTAYYGFPFGSNDFGIANTISGGGMRFHVSNTEAMRILGDGKVGIGTSAPTAMLEVAGTVSASNYMFINNANRYWQMGVYTNSVLGAATGSLVLQPNTNTTDFLIRFGTGNMFNLDSALNATYFQGLDTENGKVGINISNTVVLSTTLQVSGTIQFTNSGEACDANRLGAVKYAGGEFSFCRNGSAWETLTSIANGGAIDRIVSGTSNVIVNNNSSVTITTNGVRRLTVGENGNVGIGANNPDSRLTITSVSGTDNYMTLYNGTGSAYMGQFASNNSLYLMNSSPGNLVLGTSNTVRMVVDSGGNVGIGTSNPTARFEINGAQNGAHLRMDGSNGTYGQFYVFGGGVGNNEPILDIDAFGVDNTVSSIVRMFRNVSTTAPTLLYLSNANGTASYNIGLGANTDTFLNRFAGNVGIRTADPSTSLHVRGSIRLGIETSATLAACDANRTGAVRYTGGDFSFCRNGSTWESLTSIAGAVQGDRIVSGTSSVIVNSATGVVSVTANVDVSGSLKLKGQASECAVAADVGRMMFINARGKLQLCVNR